MTKFWVLENTNTARKPPKKAQPYATPLAAIMSALLWKRDTGKDCTVYDALMVPLYDTSISDETLELPEWSLTLGSSASS